MAKYLDYDGLSKLWSKIGDHFVKKTGNKSESITGDKKFTGTTTIGGTNIYSAIAQVLGTRQNVTSFSGNKILFKNGATFEGTALDAGLCTRGICGTDTNGTSKSELYLNYDGNNNYSRKVVLGAGSTGESLGTNCGFTFCAVRGDEMKNYVKAAIESYPGVNKKGTVTSIKLNTTYTTALSASSAEEISTSGTFNLHKVSKTGSYNDLNNKPTIPTVNNGKLTIQKNGTSVATFTANQNGDTTANISVPTKLSELSDRAFSNITSRGESFLSWGGQNFSGSYGPIDACMVPDLGANRFAFIPASAWKIEYSRDSGATWTDYGASDGQKLALTSEGVGLSIGKADGSHKATSAYMLRLTLTTTGVVYSVLNKFLLYVSTNGSSGCYVTIQGRTKANLDAKNDTWVGFVSKVPISGWSGWNVINTNGITTHGNSAGHYAQLRFIFGCTSSNTAYNGLQIQKLFAYGGVGWTVPSNMAKNGHMYKYDYNQNVKFPKKLYVNESKEVLATGQTNTFTGTQAFNSGKIYLGQGDSNSLDLGSDGRINTGNSTLVGFVGGTFTLGHSTYNTNIRGKAARPTYNGNDLALKSDIPDISGKANKSDIPTNYVTTNTDQTISGKKTFNAPESTSGEQATAVFKTANGGQIIFGKEGPNSGSMIALDQVAGTRRLNFRASATPGAIVWSQPESNSSLYYDVTNIYFRECTSVSFNSASTITFSKFANASALGTDASGNLKKVSLAAVATSGSYNDLNNKPSILTTSDVNSLIADKFNKCVEITKFAYDGGTPTDPTDSYRTQIRNRGSDIIFESAYKPTNDGNYDFDTQPKAYSSILVKSDRIILGAENDHREGLSLVLTPNDIVISDGQEEYSVLDRSDVTSSVASGSTNVLTSGGAYTALSKKQDTLVSGTNIKTVNNQSLLGSGNIAIAATLNSSSDVTIRTLSFKKGSSYSISGIYCTKVQVTVGGSVGNEGSVSFSVSSDYQSSFANGNWYFVACPTHGSWIDTMCFGITDTTATGGKLWAKRALSASQVTYDFTIIMVRLY